MKSCTPVCPAHVANCGVLDVTERTRLPAVQRLQLPTRLKLAQTSFRRGVTSLSIESRSKQLT